MTQVLDPHEAPQWFLDLFLDTILEVKGNKERLKESRTFVARQPEENKDGPVITAYGILGDNNDLIFIGRRYTEDSLEHYKYITALDETKDN